MIFMISLKMTLRFFCEAKPVYSHKNPLIHCYHRNSQILAFLDRNHFKYPFGVESINCVDKYKWPKTGCVGKSVILCQQVVLLEIVINQWTDFTSYEAQ